MSSIIYIVTGAAGFLGGTVCRQLLECGEKVRAFVLPNDPAAKYIPDGAEVVYGDLCDRESLERLFTVPEGMKSIVLHIASIVTVDPAYSQKVIDVNVGGTKNIIDMCLAHPECEKLVYCSSTGAIPEAPKGSRIREVDFFDEDKVEGCYSMSKAMATFSVYNLARNNEFDSTKAKRELGYRTRSYRDTIHDEIQWLKTSGKIA